MTSDASKPDSGRHVAGYRIVSLLGAGGMGSVYLALDERLGRQVALKTLPPSLGNDVRVRNQFLRESRAAAKVDHPNIIPIYEAGESDGLMFIAMRYVRGDTAGSLLRNQMALSPELAMSIIGPIADALDAAHESGIVHRDVKPHNILLEPRRGGGTHVYLTDFGITAFTSDDGLSAGSTLTGQIVGTPLYMAPEQWEGRPVDGQADQWALACMAFEFLSGSPPFKGTGELHTIMAAVLNTPAPSLTARSPELPSDVDAVFARALAKSPADRYGTCGDFAAALSAALGAGAASASGWESRGTPPGSPGVPPAGSPGGWSGAPPGGPPEGPPPPHGPDSGEPRPERRPDRIDIPLKESFRYVHEPSRADDDALPSLGNERLMAALEKRLRHSRGGTFLVTGFRGVGKSTLVMRALDQLEALSGPADVVVPVSLSVARSTTTERLLFAVVRRIFETLDDQGVLDRLPSPTRHALLVSYMRTSLSYTETQTRASQQAAGLTVGLGSGKLVKEVADIAAPQLQMSVNKSKSLATEAAFLAYSETDAEYDLMRIISLVNRTLSTTAGQRSWWRRLRLPWLERHGLIAPPRLRLVIILDEVDKLTMEDRGLAAVEELLSGTKNVLTMSGAHFLVIAGPDLQDRAARDAARGTGVYESVFSWRLYVPCVWDAPERLIADVVSDPGEQGDVIEMLVHYLRFKARGVPRRLLQEVNGFVSWPDDQPHLRVGPGDLERVRFFARMEQILRAFMESGTRTRLLPVAIDEDRWKLGSYFVVDWILRSNGVPFTPNDLLREGEDASFDPLLRISKASIDRLLDHLTNHEVLELVRANDAMNAIVPDVRESTEKVYRLSVRIQRLLDGFADQWDEQPAESQTLSAFPPGAVVARRAPRVIAGRYELGDIIEQGTLATVFKGRDTITGQQVAVKVLLPSLVSDPVALARFRREAEISRKLAHPQVVRAFAFIDGPDDFAIITERLVGRTLRDVVRGDGIMSPFEVVGMGQVLTGALTYLAGEDVVRLDLKPASIVMVDRGPVIADLGIALEKDAGTTAGITLSGAIVGTPAFMAPELLQGGDASPRSDIYSLGLVLYYCLAGKHPWEDLPNVAAIVSAVLTEKVDLSGLAISPKLRDVLEQATAHQPEDRFPAAAAFGDALRDTPEWHELRDTRPAPRG